MGVMKWVEWVEECPTCHTELRKGSWEAAPPTRFLDVPEEVIAAGPAAVECWAKGWEAAMAAIHTPDDACE